MCSIILLRLPSSGVDIPLVYSMNAATHLHHLLLLLLRGNWIYFYTLKSFGSWISLFYSLEPASTWPHWPQNALKEMLVRSSNSDWSCWPVLCQEYWVLMEGVLPCLWVWPFTHSSCSKHGTSCDLVLSEHTEPLMHFLMFFFYSKQTLGCSWS